MATILSRMTIIVSCSWLLVLSCKSQSNDKVGAANTNIEEHCFTRLHPGRVKDGQLETVKFVHGMCGGGYRALTKFTEKDKVAVADSQQLSLTGAQTSPLYVDGNKVYMSQEGRRIEIGKILAKDEERIIETNANISFGLMVIDSNKQTTLWEPNSTAIGDEVIVIAVK